MGLTLVSVDEERKCLHVTGEICLLGNSFSTASGRKIKPSICSERARIPSLRCGGVLTKFPLLRKPIKVLFVLLAVTREATRCDI